MLEGFFIILNMTEFQKYIQRYVDLIPSDNWLEEMKNSGNQTMEINQQFSEQQSDFAYAEGKWSLKILLQQKTNILFFLLIT